MAKNIKVSTFLEKSLDLLGEKGEGWVKGTLGRPNASRHCVLGAFHQISLELGNEVPWIEGQQAPGVHKKAVKYYESAIKAENYADNTSVPSFNDATTTKFFDIKKVFKTAIQQAKAHERIALKYKKTKKEAA